MKNPYGVVFLSPLSLNLEIMPTKYQMKKGPFSWRKVNMRRKDVLFSDEMLANVFLYPSESRSSWSYQRPTVDPTIHTSLRAVNQSVRSGRRRVSF